MSRTDTGQKSEVQPAELAGIWRRTLLLDGDLRDESTEVWWFQAQNLFVDLRLPADTKEQVEGFAGRLVRDGEVFEWQRAIDLCPAQDFPDAGRLWFEGEELVEEGVREPYLERWAREPGSEQAGADGVWATGLAGESGEPSVVVRVGDRFAWALAEPAGAGRARVVVGALVEGEWTALHASDPEDVGARIVATERSGHVQVAVRRTNGTVSNRRWATVYQEGEHALWAH